MLVIVAGLAAFAQTPKEVLEKTEAAMAPYENEGTYMIVDVKLPILGTMSTKTWMLGDKVKMEAEMMGVTIITWSDGVSDWTYDTKNNKVEITKAKEDSGSDGDLSLVGDVLNGYDISFAKETDTAWTIRCKKSRNNPDKDAPKNVDIVVAKADYRLVSLSAKASGVSISMHDIRFGGVTEKQVTFNAADYPGVTIDDQR